MTTTTTPTADQFPLPADPVRVEEWALGQPRAGRTAGGRPPGATPASNRGFRRSTS